MKPAHEKYIPFVPLKMARRAWPDRELKAPPVWCSVDLRDGNQALIDPMNVREKLSLCYYASSSYARSKNILTVSSGVETADFERAEAEIGRQLQAVQQGDWEDWEQEGALQAIRASLLSLSDSQGALENFYLGQIAAGVEETPEELAAALDQVTKERIVAAAQTVKPDTVYFLRGKEEA